MKLNKLLVLLLTLSCGYRDQALENENLLEGSWELEQITCSADSNSTVLETYLSESPIDSSQVVFSGRGFTYAVQVAGSPGCQTNVSGAYGANYDFRTSGDLNFYSVSSHSICDATVDEKNNLATGVSILFGVNEVFATNLEWSVVDSELSLQLPLEFRGSSAGPCAGSCICIGQFLKF